MKRVLFFGDSPHRIGGAQKSLLTALEHIERHGIEPVLAFPMCGPFEQLCRSRGLPVYVVESGPAFQTFEKALLRLGPLALARIVVAELAPMWRQLARLCDRTGAEAMHFNTPRGIVMAGAAAQLAATPSVLHLRGLPELRQDVWLTAQLLADAFIVVAQRLFSCLAPSSRARTTLVYNGIGALPLVPRAEARAASTEWLAATGRRVDPASRWVVSLSAPVPFKGLHHLVDAARELAAAGHHRVAWILAGEGQGDEYESWLRRRVAELGLDVHFIGHVDDVHRWLSAADVFVLTSVTGETVSFSGRTLRVGGEEGLPRSILESLAAGTPVVATDGGGVREQIEPGATGIIVPPSDPHALATAIDSILSDTRWQSRVRELGPRVVSERFSVEGAARGLAEALQVPAARSLYVARARNAIALSRDTVAALISRRKPVHETWAR